MAKSLLKKIRILTILGFSICTILQTFSAFAETLVYSNETQQVNSNQLILDYDDTGGDVTLQFGTTLAETLYWDNANTKFVFSDDVNITGNLDVDGIIYAGSGDTPITQADGTINGDYIGDNTIDDDSIDFGMGADQVGADDITVTDEFDNSDSTNVQDVLDDLDAAVSGAGHTQNTDTGTTNNIFTLDSDDSGGNVDLIFGTTVAQYLRHDGTLFHFSDDLRMDGDNSIEFRDSAIVINSSVDGQLDIDADTEVEITTTTVDLNGNLEVSGTITGATIDGDDNTLQDIPWSSVDTRTKTIQININDITILEDGSNNLADLYVNTETGSNPHEYYLLKTRQSSLQDLDLKIKVKLPSDFVDFTTASNDLSFYYKNTGINNADSKTDILVEDNDGDDAFTAADGQGLFNTSWTQHTDEFDGGSFDPAAGEYIFITLKGYASKDGAPQYSPYMGEIVITYTGK